MALFDCTISTETVVATAGATNLATQTLVITPNAGHVVSAAAFTNNTGANNNINSITLSDTTTANTVGNKVNVVVDLKNNFAMPTSNTTITIDIDGRAILFSEKQQTISGTWDSNTASNVTPSGSSGNAYTATGHGGVTATLFTQTFTCASGKFFTTSPAFVLTTGDPADYTITSTNAYTGVGGLTYHTGITYTVSYTFPNYTVVGDNIDFNISPAETIPVQQNEISSYSVPTSAIQPYGESRVLRVYGTVSAQFSCVVRNSAGEFYNFTTFAFQSGSSNSAQTIGTLGYKDILISFPAISSSDDTYTITFTPTSPTQLNLSQTHPIVILQNTFRSISYSTASLATGARSYVSLPINTTLYDAGEVTATRQYRQVSLTVTDDVAFRLWQNLNVSLHSPNTGDPLWAETNIGANNTTESDVQIVKITSVPAYSAGMTPVNSVEILIDTYDYWQGTTSSTIALNVDKFINTPPTAVPPGTTSIPNNTATTIQLAGTDPNTHSSTLVYTKLTNPTKGSVSIVSNTGLATYTPLGSGNSGADSFTYKVTDPAGDHSPAATVNVTIASSGSGGGNPQMLEQWRFNDTEDSGSGYYLLSSPNIGTATVSGGSTGSTIVTVTFASWSIAQSYSGLPSYIDNIGDVVCKIELLYGSSVLSTVNPVNIGGTVNGESMGPIATTSNVLMAVPSNHNSGNGLISGGNYSLRFSLDFDNVSQ